MQETTAACCSMNLYCTLVLIRTDSTTTQPRPYVRLPLLSEENTRTKYASERINPGTRVCLPYVMTCTSSSKVHYVLMRGSLRQNWSPHEKPGHNKQRMHAKSNNKPFGSLAYANGSATKAVHEKTAQPNSPPRPIPHPIGRKTAPPSLNPSGRFRPLIPRPVLNLTRIWVRGIARLTFWSSLPLLRLVVTGPTRRRHQTLQPSFTFTTYSKKLDKYLPLSSRLV